MPGRPSSSPPSSPAQNSAPSGGLRFLQQWGPALAAMGGIFFASSLPNLTHLPGDVSDKTAHFLGYGLLGVLVLRATSGARWRDVSPRSATVAWIVCAAYGASDEFHQWFVPGRSTSFADWVADAAGAAVAIAVILVAASGLRSDDRAV